MSLEGAWIVPEVRTIERGVDIVILNACDADKQFQVVKKVVAVVCRVSQVNHTRQNTSLVG